MARKQSVILTPTQKKELLTAAKESIKTLRTKHAELTLQSKRLTKAFEAANKERLKAYEADTKTLNKDLAGISKALAAAEAKLAELNPAPAPAAVASPTE